MKKIYIITFIIISSILLTSCKQEDNNKETTMPITTISTEKDLSEGLRITYADGFYFEPISDEIKARITGKSYPKNCDYSLDNLRYVKVRYYNFENNIRDGELIVNAAIALDIVEIFKELFDAQYQIEKIKLIDEYDANDDKSMEDNNSSAFCYRVIDGTDILSDHSLGMAIDINPLYNPYVRTEYGDRNILPVNAKEYADRTKNFKHKIEKGDVCYNAFISRGFKWGGEWEGTIDYQHFYKES